ncbi:MAG: squalene/phytoene synthase family protein [Alphaproteobacteria bacterium]
MPPFFYLKKIKSEVEQLYIFCRYLDDLGDNPNLSKQESKSKLLTIKKEIKKEKSSNSIVKNFIQLMKRYSINNKIPIDLITGIQSDFKKVQIKNFDELLIYSYRVAGTVGIMFCKIIGLKKK